MLLGEGVLSTDQVHTRSSAYVRGAPKHVERVEGVVVSIASGHCLCIQDGSVSVVAGRSSGDEADDEPAPRPQTADSAKTQQTHSWRFAHGRAHSDPRTRQTLDTPPLEIHKEQTTALLTTLGQRADNLHAR